MLWWFYFVLFSMFEKSQTFTKKLGMNSFLGLPLKALHIGVGIWCHHMVETMTDYSYYHILLANWSLFLVFEKCWKIQIYFVLFDAATIFFQSALWFCINKIIRRTKQDKLQDFWRHGITVALFDECSSAVEIFLSESDIFLSFLSIMNCEPRTPMKGNFIFADSLFS